MDNNTFIEIVNDNMEDIIGEVRIKIIKMQQVEFIGKIRKDGIRSYSQFWEESHSSGYTSTLYKLQENFRDYGLFINNKDYMIAIEKPLFEFDIEVYDSYTVPECMWAIAYGNFNQNIDAKKCWNILDQYVFGTEYTLNDNLPIIEKFPDGAEPLDQTYMLMKPLMII